MINKYRETHNYFEIRVDWDDKTKTWPIIQHCRQLFGDNDVMQALEERPWFTCPQGVYVRHDCVDHKFVTWLALNGNR